MKKILLATFCIFFISEINAQYSIFLNNREYRITKTSLVKDTAGKTYDYTETLVVLTSGEFHLKPIDIYDGNKGFWLLPLSPEEQKRRLESSPKPVESKDFKTGKKFTPLIATDLNGNPVNTDQLKGKVVVINFWFINCFPCRLERPYLNEIVSDYKNDKRVVFIAVALDRKPALDHFLKDNPFDYTQIPDGYAISKQYNVNAYPTHVILDKEGKIAFHTVSYTAATGWWMRKTIDELKSK